ncbi:MULTISPECIES: hypothetical protein [unclassified Streptomyces]|uniref:hypothetical protein n=1 Tax=unclassified Streptomyces TaxID=2593676 RepID=UPI002E143213|nr:MULTISPECIES: hypothetical protein [unclassified Streptomyces]WSR23591.1 hypothetical protein OG573_33900 [Streptomyces sp. NBC_01205]
MSTSHREAIQRTAATAALAVPGVIALQPTLADRLAHAASLTHHSVTAGSDVHREAGRIRCEHMPRGGWQVEVRCILQADNRIVDIARQAREEVRAAVTASLSQHGAVGPITVLVTVTRTIRGTT